MTTEPTPRPPSQWFGASRGVAVFFMTSILVFTLSGCKGGEENGPTPTSIKKGVNPDAAVEEKAQGPSGVDGQGVSRFSEIDLEKPFDKYLLANPLLMEVTGAKVIRLPGGNQVILSVASTVLKDNLAEERIRAERVCRIRAIASVVAEREGVHVYRVEELKEERVVILQDGQEKGRRVSDLLQITRTKVEGLTKDMPVVGRWTSKDGNVYYLAIGLVVDRKGNPTPSEHP